MRAEGIDVSSWQPEINWNKVPANLIFAFCKATEGAGYIDPEFAGNVLRMAGKRMRGGYHFYRPSVNYALQAALFAQQLNAVKTPLLELPPICDLEVTDGIVPVSRIPGWVALFMAEVQRLTGKLPALYTGAWFLAQFSFTDLAPLAKYPLWIAQWPWNNMADIQTNLAKYATLAQDFQPTVPSPWTEWLFWQWTSKAQYPGIAATWNENYLWNCDSNLANLTAQQLADKFGFTLPGGTPQPDTWQHEMDAWARGLGFTGAGTSQGSWTAEMDAWARAIGYIGVQPNE